MSHLDPLITDLALILIIAGITTLLFKWLKQPVVLGYIVAGFLCSPHFVFTPNVTDTANINIWANIGIIVLLFSLGLEFSLKKLVNVGSSAIITASIIVVGMMMMGYAAGRLLSFTYLDSLFLGAMLSMSSTTIIIKAFTDLNLRKQKFSSLVFGVLVVEDLFAVLSMVFLTSIAVKNKFEGKELFENVLKLSFFLIIWFLTGIYVLPTFFKKVKKFLNDETLLVVAMGLCLGMVVFASTAGFSSALGAFIMGSILAGTVQAERIEKVIQPVKDLFGAVFFISVGMLVNPEILYEYALPILLLSIVVIFGQILFGTSGMLISGQPLKIAVQSGFSLAQVGEFAFIIATLGMSLNVIDSYLYPIIVAVSVVTTFTTPYFIKLAGPAYEKLDSILPDRIKLLLNNYTSNAATTHTQSAWKQILGLYLGKIIFYSTIIGGLIIASLSYLIPWIKNYFESEWVLHIAVIISILIMAPFIWGLALKRIQSTQLQQIWADKRISHVPVLLMILLRFLLAVFFIMYFLSQVYSQRTGIILGSAILLFLLIAFSKKIRERILRIENTFLENLNERELRKTGKNNNIIHNIHLAQMEIKTGCSFIGQKIIDANIHQRYGVNIVSIKRGNRVINIPQSNVRLFPGDIISVAGTDEQIQGFLPEVEKESDIVDNNIDTENVILEKIIIPQDSYLHNRKLCETDIRGKSCLVVGIERSDGTFVYPSGNVVLYASDMIWLVGEKEKIESVLHP